MGCSCWALLKALCLSPLCPGGRSSLVADDGWNTVPISKGNRPIDTSRLTKITKVRLGVRGGQLSQLPPQPRSCPGVGFRADSVSPPAAWIH